MQEEAREILNDPELLEIRNDHMTRLQALFEGHDTADTTFLLAGIANGNASRAQLRPLKDDPQEFVNGVLHGLASKAEASRNRVVFRPLVVDICVYGVHFVDSLFGADVFDLDGTCRLDLCRSPSAT